MKYENEILKSFKKIGFKPRDNQVESINKILIELIDNDYKNVILSASTGTGKSIIGVVVAETYTNLLSDTNLIARNPKSLQPLASLILMHNNMLVQQYHESFEEQNDWDTIFQLKGASNYGCGHLPSTATADDCIRDSIFDYENNKICKSCEFNISRKRKNITKHLISNYSYFFTVSQLVGIDVLSQRTITVWDEAHTINDVFSSSYTLDIDDKLFNALSGWFDKIGNTEFSDRLKSIKRMIPSGSGKELMVINQTTPLDYLKIVKELFSIFEEVYEVAKSIADSFLSENKRDEYLKISPIVRGLSLKLLQYGNFLEYQYEHVFQFNESFGFIIKPIFIDKLIYKNYLDTSKKNLFMSGTISKDFLVDTIGLNPEETLELVLPPVFSPENKPFAFVRPINLNYKSLQQKDTIDHLITVISNLLDHHNEDSGIILTPSFKLSNDITKELIKLKKYNLIIHESGQRISDVITFYKEEADKGNNPVLISPSLFEGINLEGEYCRFQILTKAPFGSLADERVKYIMNNYPDIFNITTIMKLVQGAGRGVRNKEDYCATYALDANIKRLFKSPANIWKDEFLIEEF